MHFCDPPYYKAPEYKHNLDLSDYIEMTKILSGINGQFILSINDRSEMREVLHQKSLFCSFLLFMIPFELLNI